MYVGLKQPRGDEERYVTPARAAAKETSIPLTYTPSENILLPPEKGALLGAYLCVQFLVSFITKVKTHSPPSKCLKLNVYSKFILLSARQQRWNIAIKQRSVLVITVCTIEAVVGFRRSRRTMEQAILGQHLLWL